MGPIDYSTGVATPFQSALQGYQAGAAIRDDQFKLQQQQAAIQQQQQQRATLQGLITNKGAGAKEYADAITMFPQLREPLAKSWEIKNADQQASTLRDAGQWFAAVQSGKPEIAVQLMKDRAAAIRASSGDEREAKAIETYADVIDAHPEFGRAQLGMMLAAVPGGDKVISSVSTLGAEGRADELAPAALAQKVAEAKIKGVEAAAAPANASIDLRKKQVDTANIESTITDRSKRLALDSDKLLTDTQIKLTELRQKNGELPASVMTDINTAVTDSQAATQSAQRMNGLADRLMKESKEAWFGVGWGPSGSASEWLKGATGNQNELSRIRAEYNRIVTPAAMAAYKKVASGSTSDKDIETAMIGVPKDTTDAAYMASFLRGAAKLQVYDSVVNNAKAEWLSANKHLGTARSDLEVDGVRIPAGTTFKAFSDKYIGPKVEKLQAETFIKSLADKYKDQAAPMSFRK